VRLGLCCLFKTEAISFKTITARTLLNVAVEDRPHRLSAVCVANADSLLRAVKAVQRLGIGAFRIYRAGSAAAGRMPADSPGL